jgi:hypothetical protein
MEAPKLRVKSAGRPVLTVHEGGLSPSAPTYLGLRRAAEMVESAAYDLAGRESPVFISRLIEIAAELDRHARADETREPELLSS